MSINLMPRAEVLSSTPSAKVAFMPVFCLLRWHEHESHLWTDLPTLGRRPTLGRPATVTRRYLSTSSGVPSCRRPRSRLLLIDSGRPPAQVRRAQLRRPRLRHRRLHQGVDRHRLAQRLRIFLYQRRNECVSCPRARANSRRDSLSRRHLFLRWCKPPRLRRVPATSLMMAWLKRRGR